MILRTFMVLLALSILACGGTSTQASALARASGGGDEADAGEADGGGGNPAESDAGQVDGVSDAGANPDVGHPLGIEIVEALALETTAYSQGAGAFVSDYYIETVATNKMPAAIRLSVIYECHPSGPLSYVSGSVTLAALRERARFSGSLRSLHPCRPLRVRLEPYADAGSADPVSVDVPITSR